ncbi:tetratricopeptide repeat protein-like protein, partial [Dinothrombium tinctorium]
IAVKMLSLNDKAVLNAIFNPLLPTHNFEEESDVTDNSKLYCADSVFCLKLFHFNLFVKDERNAESEEVKQLELKGVQFAENGNLDEAVKCFQNAIEINPNNGSAYNNLAQVMRLKGDTDDALKNLNIAINLSSNKRNTLRQSLCQRALIYRLKGKDEECLNDFKEAAKLGSEFAKQQVVQLNPYSALCNQMLSEMISKLRQGEAVE